MQTFIAKRIPTYNAEGYIQCEICKKFYGNIATHVRAKHDIHPDQYRADFHYSLGESLMSERNVKIFRDNGKHTGIPIHLKRP